MLQTFNEMRPRETSPRPPLALNEERLTEDGLSLFSQAPQRPNAVLPSQEIYTDRKYKHMDEVFQIGTFFPWRLSFSILRFFFI